jgi:type 1 glutamine amidotransferase
MLRGVALCLLLGCGDNIRQDAAPTVIDGTCAGQPGRPAVIVFSAENLWNHPSNPVAQQALLDMCQTRGFQVTATHDSHVFDDDHLAHTDVVVFAVTSGPVLDDAAKRAFQAWLSSGHGMVGIHSASATELEFPFYIQSLGGQFCGHAPGLWQATLRVEDPSHPIAIGYPTSTVRTDEWYSFCAHPETDPNTHVLFSLDETTLPTSYPTQLLMGYHAMAWTHEGFGGRAFYMALGHTPETYAEPAFLDLIARAIDWAAAT